MQTSAGQVAIPHFSNLMMRILRIAMNILPILSDRFLYCVQYLCSVHLPALSSKSILPCLM
jgi:hypothetical protein